ncbi:unnamed protein product [Ostreobium quekettii]|uniref:Uncharacterized protein n=1 Tax=Ostreobium quekettii TaxID=121088 RepID=A0A8S1IQ88_9CHLO|nr:unnamed protein product [Ostreobium quekettii]
MVGTGVPCKVFSYLAENCHPVRTTESGAKCRKRHGHCLHVTAGNHSNHTSPDGRVFKCSKSCVCTVHCLPEALPMVALANARPVCMHTMLSHKSGSGCATSMHDGLLGLHGFSVEGCTRLHVRT